MMKSLISGLLASGLLLSTPALVHAQSSTTLPSTTPSRGTINNPRANPRSDVDGPRTTDTQTTASPAEGTPSGSNTRGYGDDNASGSPRSRDRAQNPDEDGTTTTSPRSRDRAQNPDQDETTTTSPDRRKRMSEPDGDARSDSMDRKRDSNRSSGTSPYAETPGSSSDDSTRSNDRSTDNSRTKTDREPLTSPSTTRPQ